MDKSLFYVSRSLVPFAASAAAVEDITAVANSRNAALNVTGGLIASRHAFAQILEGQASAIDTLMQSIWRDKRHTDVEILEYTDMPIRRFPKWAIAYSGPSSFVAGFLDPLLGRRPQGPNSMMIRDLFHLMLEFVRSYG